MPVTVFPSSDDVSDDGLCECCLCARAGSGTLDASRAFVCATASDSGICLAVPCRATHGYLDTLRILGFSVFRIRILATSKYPYSDTVCGYLHTAQAGLRVPFLGCIPAFFGL